MEFNNRRQIQDLDVMDGVAQNHEWHLVGKAAIEVLASAASDSDASLEPDSLVLMFCRYFLQPENMPDEIDGAVIDGMTADVTMALAVALDNDVLPQLPRVYHQEARDLVDDLYSAAVILRQPGVEPLPRSEIDMSVIAASQLMPDGPDDI